jgi:hydroxymethylpyrimidine pyrophosphatase-like HAD family hydrolase
VRFRALATDYDGTLATHGLVEQDTIEALRRLVGSGRILLLATGRQISDLSRVFSRLDLFHRVVAENGAVIYCPQTRHGTLLCAPPCEALVTRLRALGVPCSIGRAVIATTDDHEQTVRNLIRELRLDLQIALNKGSVMVLPSGVDKRTGLLKALTELALPPENVVAIGDAENDHTFLEVCGFAVAVANALPELKSRADLVTFAPHGAGVAEVINHLLTDDLAAATGMRKC